VHDFQRLAADDAAAIGGASVEQHARERQVIAGGREQAQTAALEGRRRVAGIGLGHRVASPAIARQEALEDLSEGGIATNQIGMAVHRRQAVTLARRDAETGIAHAEWREQAFTQEIAERLIGQHLDELRGDVDAETVMPGRAGMEGQRHARKIVDERFQRARGVVHEPRFTILRADRVILEEIVGQAAGMGHHVPHLHGTEHVLVLDTAVRHQDLGAGEGRNEFRHRVDQLAAPFLVQQHERRADDGLGHRVDAEDGVVRHGDAGFAVLPADTRRVHQPSASHDHGVKAAISTGVDVALQGGRDALEALGVHAHVFRGGVDGNHGLTPA
jgi:hypothetical protein